MKRFAVVLAFLFVVGGCTDDKPTTENNSKGDAIYVIGDEFAVLDEGPNGESMYIKIEDSTYVASHDDVAFDITITNKGKVAFYAPAFHAFNKSKDCGKGVVTKDRNHIKQGESRKVTIIWNCGKSLVLKDITITTKVGDATLTWVHN